MRWVFIALVLLVAQAALADLKVSLVTISPGTEIFQAFGHTALYVEDSEKPGEATYYAYGQADMMSIVGSRRPLAALRYFFENQLRARVERDSKPLDATLGVPRSILDRYYTKKTVRVTTVNELVLTQDQAKKLIELVKDDAAKGRYKYHNFKNNCATSIRDHLFSDDVLGKELLGKLEKGAAGEAKKSFNDLAIDAMNEAVAASPTHTIQLLPGAMNGFYALGAKAALTTLGLGMFDYESGESFQNTMAEMGRKLPGLRGSDLAKSQGLATDEQFDAFLASFHSYFFSEEYADRDGHPVTRYQSLFLPNKLREALKELNLLGKKEIQIVSGENGPVVSVKELL